MLRAVRFIAKEKLLDPSKHESQDSNAKRKEAGLDWMTAPPKQPAVVPEVSAPVPEAAEQPRSNPKELNPYFKDGADGYPSEDAPNLRARQMKSGVGDGGASWRLKALKRAREQAEREGKNLHEVVSDRFGSLDTLTAGITGRRAAHANAHHHAIRDRKRKHELGEETQQKEDTQQQEDISEVQDRDRDSRGRSRDARDRDVDRDRDVNRDRDRRNRDRDRDNRYQHRDEDSGRHRLKAPRMDDSFKWKSTGDSQQMRPEDAAFVRTAAASCNTHENDGSFMRKFMEDKKLEQDKGHDDLRKRSEDAGQIEKSTVTKPPTAQDANAIAAKAMRLRLMGKTQEADALMKEVESARAAREATSEADERVASESMLRTIAVKQKHGSEHKDLDAVLASRIGRTRDGYRPDEEYDDVGLVHGLGTDSQRRKSASKEAQRNRTATVSQFNRLRTQQERCNFCFENPSRAKHLTIAIANFTYLMLPPTTPIVPGHCYIVPMQHEGSTRNVDETVWEELRNFKKCLIKMFNQDDKEVIFMETVMGLSEQRRHCLLECVPVPSDVIGQAPLYFKKAIDEAEDEWSQHNSKKLIDTRIKGLKNSIPKNFPYFHVEFGLEGGYCHVIDDETSFKPQFGRDVLIGLLKLPQERMHQRSKNYGSLEQQKAAAQEFARQWKPHDWTKMLD